MLPCPPLLLALALARAPAPFQESERPVATATRTKNPPRIDGKLDDPAWSEATPIGELTQVEPLEGVAPSERSDIRFLYDDDHLYMAVRCYDSQPELIFSTTKERDGLLEDDDRVEMIFDTFGDDRNAFFFQINAAGSKGDALVTNNGATFNKPWDGIWDGVASIDSQGWTAELSLPFKTLNFKEGLSTWGFNILRHIGRKREQARWSRPSRDYNLFHVYHAGDLGGLQGIRQGIGLDVVPFFVTHWQNDRVGEDKTLLGEPGFDLFYKVIPSLTFSMTVNTDFAETEVDQRQINLTRFPLFFPERRDFFLQDAGQFAFGSRDNALVPFFSRRIGLSSTGEEVPILAGAKLTGRAGDYGIGVLDVQTEDDPDLAGQNLFAGRITRNVGEQSTVGAIVTHGNPEDTGDNAVFGLDATLRTSEFQGDKDLITTGFFLQSETEDVHGQQSAFGLDVVMPSDLFSWNLGALEVQEDFEADLGFVPRTDIRRYLGGVNYQPRPDIDGVRQLEFSADSVAFTDTEGELETWVTEVQPLGVFFESGEVLLVEVEHTSDELFAPFEISSGIFIPAGEYEYTRGRFEVGSGSQRALSVELVYEVGDFFDGDRTDYFAALLWQPSPLFQGEASYQLNDVSLVGGDFDTQLANLRANISFTPELSWNNFLQWDNESDTLGVQSRVRWIPQPGQEVFLVLNENLETGAGPTVAEFQELSFKITYALRF